MKPPTGSWWVLLCAFVGAILVANVALPQVATPTGNYAGTAGSSCAGLGMQYAWPDANGQVLQCVSNVWTLVSLSGSGAISIVLGSSASSTNPARSGEITTGLYTAATGKVDVSSLGTQVGEFSSSGLNLGTTTALSGVLKIGGANGISYPAGDTNVPFGSIAIGSQALASLPTMPVGTTGTYIFASTAVGYQALSSASMTTAAIGNTAVGYLSLSKVTSGYTNVALGGTALRDTTTGYQNTAIGQATMQTNTTGSNNVAVGQLAMEFVTGSDNVGIGRRALGGILSGTSNIGIGGNAGTSITSGSRNVVVGPSVASTILTSGTNNILIGNDATTDTFSGTTSTAIGIGSSVHPGTGDIAIGYQALATNIADGNGNIAIGSQVLSGASMTTAAVGETGVGYQALKALSSGRQNTALGYQALSGLTTAGNTTAIGYNAASTAAGGNGVTAIGANALRVSAGDSNTAVGSNALLANTAGANNTALGVNALSHSTSGTNNVGIGLGAGNSVTTGFSNVALGSQVASTTLTTGSNNILIGTGSAVDTPLPGTSNFLNIANLIYGTSIGSATSPGNVGIGTATPLTTLHIVNGGPSGAPINQSQSLGLLVENNGSNNSFHVLQTATAVGIGLTVSNGGNVGIGSGAVQPNIKLTVSGASGFPATSGSTQTAVAQIGNALGPAVLDLGADNATGTSWLQSTNSGNLATNYNLSLNPNGGSVGIGTTAPLQLLHVGSASASGIVMELQSSAGACTFAPGTSSLTTTCSSDVRLKSNIHDTTEALPWLATMRVRDFTVRATGESSTGVIAQELMETHPDMVRTNPDGYLGVDVPNPWRVIKALQELKATNDNQAIEINELRTRLDALEAAQH